MKRTTTPANALTTTPIGDQTGVEQSLRNSELRYRRLFESARDGILILNAETGSISDVNPYLIDMSGYSREEFVDRELWEVGAFKDIDASMNSFLALQKNELSATKTCRSRRKTVVWFQWNSSVTCIWLVMKR